jgi:hypothetical protein
MDIYHIWFNLKDGVRDTEFAESASAYLNHLKGAGAVASYRITRRKLGLGPPQLPATWKAAAARSPNSATATRQARQTANHLWAALLPATAVRWQ